MNKVKQFLELLLYIVVLAMIPITLNYISENFSVPKEISIPAFVALLLLGTLIIKWNKLPKLNIVGLEIMIACSIVYSAIVSIDHYIVDFFQPNIYWMSAAYSPIFLFAVKAAKNDESS